jgi:hypothetical protein
MCIIIIIIIIIIIKIIVQRLAGLIAQKCSCGPNYCSEQAINASFMQFLQGSQTESSPSRI